MSDTVSRPASHGRFNLNQDITRALDELGKVDYPQVLRTHFPSRNLVPREYARGHSVRRRVKCVYAGPQDEIPTSCPAGWDLLAVVGVGFTRRETEDIVEKLETARPEERVLVGVPLRALPGSAQFKELAALDHLLTLSPYSEKGPAREALVVRRSSLRKSLLDRLRKSMAPSSFRWLHRGEVLEEAPAGNRNRFFSGVLQALYPDTPRVKVTGSRREQVEALGELLELSGPLQLPASARQGSARVLRGALAERGILEVADDRGSFVRYEVQGEVPGDHPLGRTWNLLLEKVVGAGDRNRKVDLPDLLRWLADRPLSLRGPLVALLLGALLRRHYPNLELVQGDEPIPPSGVGLRSALARPKGWQLHYHPTTEDEEAFLVSLVSRFGGGREDRRPGGPDLWERAREAMLLWRDRLPPLARAATRAPGGASARLIQLLADEEKTRNAQDLLGSLLPELFGEDGIPIAEGQQGLLDRIDQARLEIEGYPEHRKAELVPEIGRLLGGEDPPEDGREAWLGELAKRWQEGLHPATAGRSFSEGAEALRQAVQEGGAFGERWFEALPRGLGLPPVEEWAPDQERPFLARLSRARLELELWRLRELFPLSQDPDQRRDQVRHWIREACDGANLDELQRESLLIDLLDGLVWK